MNTKKQEKKVSFSCTTMTEMIMPNDTNPMGSLMGGNLLRWMDVASAICAGRHCEKNVVTASVDHVSFSKPIRLGDVITLEATVTRAFSSSVEVFVEVSAVDIKGHNFRKCNFAYFTFVALDEQNSKPVSVPKVIPDNKIQQQRYDGAIKRREMRLILAGRLKPQDATEIKALFESIVK